MSSSQIIISNILTDRFIRDIVNLFLYGGAFIGLCASSLTALTFEVVSDVSLQFPYISLIGVSTAALYSAHRVIGLRKLTHVITFDRYTIIRKYKQHIWLYCIIWIALTAWFFLPLINLKFILWLLPGGSIALAYILPLLSQGRRLRDLGWIKIILIGWSWSWLTAFLPAYYFGEAPLPISILIGIERMIFILAITIPFEIRDLTIDKSVGLVTMPSKFGMKWTMRIGLIFCAVIIILSLVIAYHFLDSAYVVGMSLTCILVAWILKKSIAVTDDYFFSGVTDGTMILAVVFYWICGKLL